jgi:hypothetical protein
MSAQGMFWSIVISGLVSIFAATIAIGFWRRGRYEWAAVAGIASLALLVSSLTEQVLYWIKLGALTP